MASGRAIRVPSASATSATTSPTPTSGAGRGSAGSSTRPGAPCRTPRIARWPHLEAAGRLDLLVTQNIDGLHLAAGSSPDRLVEIHGSMRESICLACGDRRPMAETLDRVRAGDPDPACERLRRHPEVGDGQLRPEPRPGTAGACRGGRIGLRPVPRHRHEPHGLPGRAPARAGARRRRAAGDRQRRADAARRPRPRRPARAGRRCARRAASPAA